MNRHFFLALAGSLLIAGDAALAANTPGKPAARSTSGSKLKTYKWVDKDGVTHYGDTVPAEYVAQGHEELNSQGVPVRESPRQLTPAEAEEAAKKAAAEARRRQHDSFLLTTYTKVGDIESLRDERVGLIDAQMEIARGSIASTDQRLTALQKRLLAFKPYSEVQTTRRVVPDKLAEEVVHTLSERRSLQARLDAREKEKSEQLALFETDIARYKELTTRPAQR
jgi:hypothetical protein